MMTWIFGKKNHNQPEVYVAEETVEGFTSITPQSSYVSPLPPYPTLPKVDAAAPYPYVAPYPPLPSQSGQPVPSPYTQPAPTYVTPPYGRQTIKEPTSANPLDSIPFVLSPALAVARTSSIANPDSVQRELTQLKSRLESNYRYDFSIEKSVIQEHYVSLSDG